MLLELFQWLTTPCSPTARKLGFLGEAIGIAERQRRLAAAWAPHLDATKRLIREAVTHSRGRRCAVVLGSGPLLDVPLAELARAFDRVELIDMVHLRSARQHAAAFPNVTLREADVTGMADAVLAGERTDRPGTPPVLPPDTDLVISVNLLAQLPEPICARRARRGAIAVDDRARLARDIINAHIDWLAAGPAPACLVTETARAYVGSDGIPVGEWDALHGVILPPADAIWHWDIAPDGETRRGFTQRNTVCGFVDLAAARARAAQTPV